MARTHVYTYRREPAVRAQRRHIIENTKSQKFRINIILFRTFLFHHRALAVSFFVLRANNQIIKNRRRTRRKKSGALLRIVKKSKKQKEMKNGYECKENDRTPRICVWIWFKLCSAINYHNYALKLTQSSLCVHWVATPQPPSFRNSLLCSGTAQQHFVNAVYAAYKIKPRIFLAKSIFFFFLLKLYNS